MKISIPLVIITGALLLSGCTTVSTTADSESKTALRNGAESRQQPATDPLLARLAGKWILRGTIDNKETTHDIDAQWVLNNEYLRLHEESRERGTNGGPAYEAIVFISWDRKPGRYSCLWLDSTGGGGLSGDGIGRGKPDGDSIPFVFKFPSGDIFHNTFAYEKSTDTWRWIMEGEINGKLQPFGRVTLTRK